MTSGIVTAILLIAFIGLCLWAWSKRRQRDFAEASRLPLEEDRTQREPRA
ncbi:MAG: CcoQ/FixQ family Cbb3-type cytochrome c oxidase assembly chaperone [Xanthomonadales bacterium]|nr:CcoQ/FixQ family Cbb3-type cytochrome c oxidase assembly chaperone [Xanthomonadales bacterium]